LNTREAYAYWSATYDADRNLTRDLDQVVTKASLADLRFRSILEIGCGTGKNTPLLAQIGENVCALDFSAAMLDQAKAKPRSDRIHFVLADITRPWPCEDRSFDLIACNLVLEHIRDLSFIFSEATRVLADVGRVFVCELHPFRQYQGTQANFQRGNETVAIPAFIHHISEFLESAARHGLSLQNFKEWWDEEAEQTKPPRLVSFMFEKDPQSRSSPERGWNARGRNP
jgi:ubiquinone/menaquinone biosynthesis C-methylase UbiE